MTDSKVSKVGVVVVARKRQKGETKRGWGKETSAGSKSTNERVVNGNCVPTARRSR